MGAFEKDAQGRFSFFEGGFRQGLAGDQEQVGPASDVRQDALHGGAQKTFGAIASHGGSHSAPGGDSHAHAGRVAGLGNQDDKRVGIRLSKTPHPLEIG